MSLAFSDTTHKNGIIQGIERELFGDDGDGKITGNTVRFQRFTADVNLALAKAWSIILKAGGRWQWDDNNHGDFPIIRAPLVSGQREYTFTTDGSGNTVLEIFKTFVKQSNGGVYQEIDPVDVQTGRKYENTSFTDGLGTTGVPQKYDKTGNGIIFDVVPDYSDDEGIMVYVSREGIYFTTSDTTRKPGFAGDFHEYLIVRPAYKYASRNNMPSAAVLRDEVLRIEKELESFYGRREKDQKPVMRPRITPFI